MTTLNNLLTGRSGRIRRLDGAADACNRLRELGLAENSVVRLLQAGSPVLCQVQHARIGISAELAVQVVVEPL